MAFENPVLNKNTFKRATVSSPPGYGQPGYGQSTYGQPIYNQPAAVMTASGTYAITAALLVLVIAAGAVGWSQVETIPYGESWIPTSIPVWVMPVAIAAFIVAIAGAFFPKASPIIAPLYALGEGLVLGIISKLYEAQSRGIVFEAVLATIAVFMTMLFLYSSHIIKVTNRYIMVVTAATIGIVLVYVASFILSLLGVHFYALAQPSIWTIGISLFVVVVAALNLPLDFNFIERGAAAGAPKYMEWYGAFGLLVTIVWIYISILRLLSQLQSRR